MKTPEENAYRSFWMLGAAMTVPVILVSGPLAGYFIGEWVFVRYLKWPDFWVLFFVTLGFIGSILQIIRIIKRMKQSETGAR